MNLVAAARTQRHTGSTCTSLGPKVATTFAMPMQPICNATRAAHALRSDPHVFNKYAVLAGEYDSIAQFLYPQNYDH
jgi:hypothetical protein